MRPRRSTIGTQRFSFANGNVQSVPNSMRLLLGFVLLLLPGLESYAQLPVFGADSIMKHYNAKADGLMVGDSSLYDYFMINIYGISMYASLEDKKVNKPEYKVTWQELPIYKRVMQEESRASSMDIMLAKAGHSFSAAVQKQYSGSAPAKEDNFHPPEQPLAGMRIVIDPGHVANDTAMGHLEQKFIFMNVPKSPNTPLDSVPVAFAEGQLTWQTATLLATRLRNLGAEVMLTRNAPGMTAFGKTFQQWLKDDYTRTLDSMLKEDPKNQNLKDLKSGRMKEDRSRFRFVFRDAELRKRAEIINEFNPDLTVVIHYNVDETNAPWNKPTTKNFNMLFVPGAFQAGELDDAEKRFDFLRLLLLDDLENSIDASSRVAFHFQDKLKVPLANPSDAGYLSTSCRKTKKQGVYARNLSMTRLVHGTIVYGETLYQDNAAEALALSNMTITDRVSGEVTSKRVMQVTDAYLAGIMDWWFATH